MNVKRLPNNGIMSIFDKITSRKNHEKERHQNTFSR